MKRQILSGDSVKTFCFPGVSAYLNETSEGYVFKIFTGRKSKPSEYKRCKKIEDFENVLQRYVKNAADTIAIKEGRKDLLKENNENLKKDLVPGTFVVARFSYNMTFNKFFRVICNTKSTYKLEKYSNSWISGNGFTGSVKVGEPTGEYVTAKLTSGGLKVDGLYAEICTKEDSFYENHMD